MREQHTGTPGLGIGVSNGSSDTVGFAYRSPQVLRSHACLGASDRGQNSARAWRRRQAYAVRPILQSPSSTAPASTTNSLLRMEPKSRPLAPISPRPCTNTSPARFSQHEQLPCADGTIEFALLPNHKQIAHAHVRVQRAFNPGGRVEAQFARYHGRSPQKLPYRRLVTHRSRGHLGCPHERGSARLETPCCTFASSLSRFQVPRSFPLHCLLPSPERACKPTVECRRDPCAPSTPWERGRPCSPIARTHVSGPPAQPFLAGLQPARGSMADAVQETRRRTVVGAHGSAPAVAISTNVGVDGIEPSDVTACSGEAKVGVWSNGLAVGVVL